MVRRMSEPSVEEQRAVVAEIVQALGDDVAPESRAWWQYLLVLTELGPDRARHLVSEVSAVEAAGGMTIEDGSRRRTRGGVFFVLAYEQLGPKRTRSVRWRAGRRFQEGMLQRFLQLLALVVPASSHLSTVAAEPLHEGASALEPRPRSRVAAEPVNPGAAPRPPGKRPRAQAPAAAAPPPAAAAKVTTAKPAARRPEPEVLVVRRRPAPSAPDKSGPSTPGAGG